METKTRSPIFERLLREVFSKLRRLKKDNDEKRMEKAKKKFSSVLGSELLQETHFWITDFDEVRATIGQVELLCKCNKLYYLTPYYGYSYIIDTISDLGKCLMKFQPDYVEKIMAKQ